MHKIYEDKGAIELFSHIQQILYSTVISSIIITILKYFSLSEENILKLKKERHIKNSQVSEVLRCLTIKFLLFFIISILFLILFWYYLSSFCAVYKNTQYILIKDTLISYCLSLFYPFGFNLLPGMFRIPSLKNNNEECIYKFSKIIQIIL
jgi:magnesium-transporting ATPase (P-type)